MPTQSEGNRRPRWRWGAGELLRAFWLRPVPIAPGGWAAADTAPRPITPPSRVRGAPSGGWDGPGNDLVPRFGCGAALARWCSGCRLARRTGLTDGLIRGGAIVPAAVDERRVADGLLAGEDDVNLLTDQGCRAAAWARTWVTESNVHLRLAPSRTERARRTRPAAVQQFVAACRNRSETANDTLQARLHLEAHLAHKFGGVLTRVAAKVAAYSFAKLWPLDLIPV